jgi:hypothetical protein
MSEDGFDWTGVNVICTMYVRTSVCVGGWAQVVHIASQVCRGLHYLHPSIVHGGLTVRTGLYDTRQPRRV